jgi:hypothetical protein
VEIASDFEEELSQRLRLASSNLFREAQKLELQKNKLLKENKEKMKGTNSGLADLLELPFALFRVTREFMKNLSSSCKLFELLTSLDEVRRECRSHWIGEETLDGPLNL